MLGEKTFKILKIVEQEDKSFQFQSVANEIADKDIVAPLKCHLYLSASPDILVVTEA